MSISTLGLNIKALRERKGWSLYKLREESGIGYTTLHDIENGNSQNLNSNSLEKVAGALGTTIDGLLNVKPVESVNSDIADTIEDILNSDKIKLDGVELNEYELEFINDYLKAGIDRVRTKRNEK